MMNAYFSTRFGNTAAEQPPSLPCSVNLNSSIDKKLLADMFEMIKTTPLQGPDISESYIYQLRKLMKHPFFETKIGELLIEQIPHIATKIRKIYPDFVYDAEKEQVRELIKNDGYNNSFLKRNYEFANLERDAAGIDKTSTVAFVGSGPNPFTAVKIAEVAKNVVCLDSSSEARQLATDYLHTNTHKKQSLQNIEVATLNPEAMDYKLFSHIFVASMLPNRSRIIERIKETISLNATIVLRNTDGLKILMSEPLNQQELMGLDIIGKLYGGPHRYFHSFICKKKVN